MHVEKEIEGENVDQHGILRRFSQFVELAESLQQIGPAENVPELPPKNWLPGEWAALGVRANRNVDFLRERCVGLVTFLRLLLKNQDLPEPQLDFLHSWLAADSTTARLEAWTADEEAEAVAAPSARLSTVRADGAAKSKLELLVALQERASMDLLKRNGLHGRPVPIAARTTAELLIKRTQEVNGALDDGSWSDALATAERADRDFVSLRRKHLQKHRLSLHFMAQTAAFHSQYKGLCGRRTRKRRRRPGIWWRGCNSCSR